MSESFKASAFRKLVKIPLSVILTEVSLAGLTGYVSIVGRTDKGNAAIDVDFIKGSPVSCRAEFPGSEWGVEGLRCLDVVESLICVECFIESRRLPKEMVKIDEELLRNPRSEVEAAITPPKGGEDVLNRLSALLENPAILASLAKASRTAAVIKARIGDLLTRLVSMAGKHPLSLMISDEGVRVIAIAFNHELKAIHMRLPTGSYRGVDALELIEGGTLDKVTSAIVSYVEASLLLPPLRDALTGGAGGSGGS